MFKHTCWLPRVWGSLLLSILASPAQAEITFLNTWGTTGPGAGEFNDPRGVAVAPTGEVYVADQENDPRLTLTLVKTGNCPSCPFEIDP